MTSSPGDQAPSRPDAPSERKVVVLVHVGHPNDYEALKYSAHCFAAFGFEQIDFSVADPRAGALLQALLRDRGHEIYCFFSFNYHAAKIRANDAYLHQFTSVPLVVMMFDHPVYFLDQQTPELADQIVFAPGPDAADFVRRYYPAGTTAVVNLGARPPFDDGQPNYENFVARKNVLLCPMNLTAFSLNLDQSWQRIRELPAGRRAVAKRLAEAALTDCVTPFHVLGEELSSGEVPPAERREFLGDQMFVLNFVKLWRRTRMIRTLVDLPILIGTDFVPADLDMKYPSKFTRFSMAETIPLYRRHRFVLNSSPLLATFHDRVLNAWYSNSVCITDRNVTLCEAVTDGREVAFFDYDRDDMLSKVAAYLDDPQSAYDLTARCWEMRSVSTFHLDSYRRMIDAVDRRWAQRCIA